MATSRLLFSIVDRQDTPPRFTNKMSVEIDESTKKVFSLCGCLSSMYPCTHLCMYAYFCVSRNICMFMYVCIYIYYVKTKRKVYLVSQMRRSKINGI